MWIEITNPYRHRSHNCWNVTILKNCIDGHKVKVASIFHQTCRLLTVDIVVLEQF